MKKINYLLLGLAGLAMASCSQEDLLTNGKGEGNYHVTINLPADMATRANPGDGLTANVLKYAIYDNNGTFVDAFTTNFGGQISTTVDLNLVAGASYQIAFFAQGPDSGEVYEFNPNPETGTPNITVNYDKMTANYNNADEYDCFYNLLKTGTIGSDDMSASVTLVRPMAQINWGTTDLASKVAQVAFGPTGENLVATLKTKAFNTYSLLDNVVDTSIEAEEIEIGAFARPSTGWTFPANTETTTYDYVAMQFVLAQKESEIYDLDLTIASTSNETVENTIHVSSAPLQANYQTNIYGSLLSDNVTFTVTKQENWTTPEHNIAIWDGVSAKEPMKNSNGAYVINNPGEWVWLTKNITSVPSEPGRLWNTDIILNADLDFAGNEVQGMYYSGTLNGQGHTIKNLTIYPKSSYATGLFGGDISNGGDINVENLNFENVKLSDHVSNYGWVGVIIGDIQKCNVNLTNVNVNNATLSGVNSIGGLVGFVASGRTLTVNGCSVTNSSISNIPVLDESGNVCGMVGRVVGTANFGEDNVVENVTIDGYWTSKRGINSIAPVAALNGTSGTINGLENVKTPNVTVNKYEVTNQIKVGSLYYDTLAEALANATSGSTVELGIGTYDATADFASNKTLTITGMGAAYSIIQYPMSLINTPNSTFNFSNLTIQAWQQNGMSMGFIGATETTFTNVQFIGEFHAISGNATFTDCQFNQNNKFDLSSGRYGLWIESRTDGSTTVTNCTFNNFLAKGILVYDNTGGKSTMGNITVKDCSFTASAPYKGNAAIEMHSENYLSAGTLSIDNTTYNSSYSALWQEKNNVTQVATNFYKVVVNGQVVQNGGQTATN